VSQIVERDLVPRWLIRKICEKNGVRLSKRELWKPPNEVKVAQFPMAPLNGRHNRHVEVSTIERQIQTLADKKFEFENWEYRFWCVEIAGGAPTLAYCRCCSKTYFHRKPRRAHLAEDGCAKNLLKAYGLLLRDKKCVVCDGLTQHQEWGVPLCNKNYCKDRFMHDDTQPECLESALMLILNKELLEG
jgi:hypothetical protein